MSASGSHFPRVAIVSAVRTAIGSFGGGFRRLAAHQLAAEAIREGLRKASLQPGEVAEVILGNVLQAGQGQNPARRAAVLAGIPYETPAYTVNQVCGSGLKAIVLGAASIRMGRSEIVVAGGMESMSAAPHLLPDHRWGQKTGASRLFDAIIHDALWDSFYDCHMGITAEKVAAHYGISREVQDAYAAESQRRYATALAADQWRHEITPTPVAQKNGDIILIEHDEHPRPNVSASDLERLSAAFAEEGTITAGNASGINDGAAMLVLASEQYCSRRGITPLAWLGEDECIGLDPMFMGMGPAHAIQRMLARCQRSIDDYELIEINEAFAAQVLAVCGELDLDPQRINRNGGAIALGHPVGASGARIVVTLVHQMARRACQRGLASTCVGGGMGMALEVLHA